MSKKPKFIIDCADHAGFVRLAKGEKTILTRANKSSQQHEDYTQAMPGDILELVDTQSNEKIYVRIEGARFFSNISKLFNNSKIADETFGKHFNNENELRAEYESNRPGYTKVLDNNGIVAWRVALVEL